MIFVDTNYFLRFIIDDVKEQHQKAISLFTQAAQGKINLFTSSIVVFEIYWVLFSNYQKNKEQIIKILDKILDMSFIDFEHHSLLKQSLILYKNSPLGLVDTFNLLYSKSQGAKDFKTFDIKLSKKFTSL